MRFAYADPPYLGCGKRLYGEMHPRALDWDDMGKHVNLIDRLYADFPDGWAYSCNSRDLKWVLEHIRAPIPYRLCAWCKTFAQIRPTAVQWAWEPLVVVGGRPEPKGRTTDWMACSIELGSPIPGKKPLPFCRWLFELLGLTAGDELVDLFPGTGAVGAAWEAYRAQVSLLGKEDA